MPDIGAGLSDYRVPPFFDRFDPEKQKQADQQMLGKIKEYISVGKTFVTNQGPMRDADRAMDILGENTIPGLAKGSSTVSVNLCKREFREMVAAMSNLRPMENCTTSNAEMKDSVHKMNKRCKSWWIKTFADRKYRSAVQYALGLGTAYISPWWDNNFYGYGQGEIALKTYGPASVLPVMLPADNDLQKAYVVTIVEPTPLHLVLAAYPDFADKLVPNRRVPGWLSRAVDKAKQTATDLFGILNTSMDSMSNAMPEVDVYYSYIMDLSVNNTGKTVSFGKPGTNFFYTVPHIGQDIPTGILDATGRMQSVKASHEDALNFPLRRLVVSTDTCILKDDTSPWLHGKVPAIQLRFDDYPWEFLGYSIMHDTWRIQAARNRMLRTMENSFHVRMRPPLKWDENLISEAAVARINTQKPGQTLKCNMGVGNPIEPLLDPKHWDIPGWAVQFVQGLAEDQGYMSLAKDMVALAKAKQIPSGDSIEKIMDAAGQVPQDMARGGEKTICELASMWFPLEIQFSTARNYVKVLGEDGMTKEMMDFRPGSLIPSHLPGEKVTEPSIYQDWERLRYTVEQMSFEIEPYSQAALSRIGRSLQMLQYIKAGMPIDPWTALKPAGIDLGPEPPGTTNVMERWRAWKLLQVEQQVEAAEIAQEAQAAAAGAGGAAPPGAETRGRPQTNQHPPKIAQKDGGARSTVVTSR